MHWLHRTYGAGGWALAEAVPAQEETIAAFTRRYGKPKRVIGFGYSMGGLVTTALAERARPTIDGGISFCSSMGGALGMMNTGLDGAFVFRALVAPDKGIEVVSIANDQGNSALVRAAAQEAGKTPAGRARIALAGVFGAIPGWTRGQPAATRRRRRRGAVRADHRLLSGRRVPAARRTGAARRWELLVEHGHQLHPAAECLGPRGMIEELYAKAGISLEADLATLAAAPRISANPQAVEYMRKHYTPTADPKVPLLAVQAFGDGTTSPSLQRGVCRACPADDDGCTVCGARRSLLVQRRGNAGLGEAARIPARQRQVASARGALCSARARAAAAPLFPGKSCLQGLWSE